MSLPKDRDARNALPVWDGCIAYFPDVWAEVAKVSVLGNKQHNIGERLHWNTRVSTDHRNKAFRHMLDDAAGEIMDDGGETYHLAKALWRIAAALQIRIWQRQGRDEHGNLLPSQVAPRPVTERGPRELIDDYQKLQQEIRRQQPPKPPMLGLPQEIVDDMVYAMSPVIPSSTADQDREFTERLNKVLGESEAARLKRVMMRPVQPGDAF